MHFAQNPKKYIRFSVYLIVPLIFFGLIIFTGLAIYSMTLHFSRLIVQENAWKIYGTISAIAILAFFVSITIIRVLLKPLQKFEASTALLPILTPATLKGEGTGEYGEKELIHYGRMLEEASHILGKVEARELFPDIIGPSRIMRDIFGQIMKVAPTETTVMLLGESGTGKELIARAIYDHSKRRGKPFIVLNCVAIPEGLFESELFGHEKGSFTGAVGQKIGKLELADKGSIFLDEIGDMPLNAQAKLLRVLQEKNFERVGGSKLIQIDVRIIAATNKNLSEMIKIGTFREDLFYRLNVFVINLPALRNRKEDIPFLAQYFLAAADKSDRISDQTMQNLIAYDWPGNVRELKNCLERAAVLSEDGSIAREHLPDNFRKMIIDAQDLPKTGEDPNLDKRIDLFEKALIIDALQKTGGIQSKAATLLGINQRSLWHRVKKHQIDLSAIKK